MLEAVVALPLVVPPTVLGFLHVARHGAAWTARKIVACGVWPGLAFTFAGLVIASVLYSFPFAVQPLIASFETVDRKLPDAPRYWRRPHAHLSPRQFCPYQCQESLTALVLSFAHTLGEFGVVLMAAAISLGVNAHRLHRYLRSCAIPRLCERKPHGP